MDDFTTEEANQLYEGARTLLQSMQEGNAFFRALQRQVTGRRADLGQVKEHFWTKIKPRLDFVDSPQKSHLPPQPTEQSPKQEVEVVSSRVVPEVIVIEDSSGELEEVAVKPKTAPVKNRRLRLQYEIWKTAQKFNITEQTVLYVLYLCNGSFEVARSYLFHQQNGNVSVVRDKYFTKRDDALLFLRLDKELGNPYHRPTLTSKQIEEYCRDEEFAKEQGLEVFIPKDDYDEQYWSGRGMAEQKTSPLVYQRKRFLQEFEKFAVEKLIRR